MRTLQELAIEVVHVQNACNPMGITRAFNLSMIDLHKHLNGTEELAMHPITILWIDKLASLAGIQNLSDSRIDKAFADVYELIGEDYMKEYL